MRTHSNEIIKSCAYTCIQNKNTTKARLLQVLKRATATCFCKNKSTRRLLVFTRARTRAEHSYFSLREPKRAPATRFYKGQNACRALILFFARAKTRVTATRFYKGQNACRALILFFARAKTRVTATRIYYLDRNILRALSSRRRYTALLRARSRHISNAMIHIHIPLRSPFP